MRFLVLWVVEVMLSLRVSGCGGGVWRRGFLGFGWCRRRRGDRRWRILVGFRLVQLKVYF